jgi:hypothetical protein
MLIELRYLEGAESEGIAQLRQILCSADLLFDSAYDYADSNIVCRYIVLVTLGNQKNRM